MPSRTPSSSGIGIDGVGYMGIATALAFARRGLQVYAYDVNPQVRARLRAGQSPYREPGLSRLLREQTRGGRFAVVESLQELVARSGGIFLCLPTPRGRGGRIDLAPLRLGVVDLGRALRTVRGYRVVVVKSTVVPGTTEQVIEPLLRRTSEKGRRQLGVAMNPEFLSEGTMVRDATYPQRIVLGVSDPAARNWLRRVFKRFGAPIFELSPTGAELVKYGSNSLLALKVSFANETSRLAERLGVNVDDVMEAVGSDSRLGKGYLRAGPGFGGSCFDKDLRAIVQRGRELGIRLRSSEVALAINDDQVEHVLNLVRSSVGPLRRKTITVLGLAFKAGTDDVRESRAFPIVARLAAQGARVRVHDPQALVNFRRAWEHQGPPRSSNVEFCPSVAQALRRADAAVLQVDWPAYRRWPRTWSRTMRVPLLVDLRRAIGPKVERRAHLRVVALGVGVPAGAKRGPVVARAPRQRP
jgi:UDPglucose 6-dehydrogenase